MDRRRNASPVYSRQWSGGSSSTGSSSPAMSPAHPLSRQIHSGFSTVKRTQNVAAKVAAQRLAKVMASQTTADDEEEEDDDDDLGFRFGAPPPAPSSRSAANGNNISAGASSIPAISVSRPNRSPSPAVTSRICLCIQHWRNISICGLFWVSAEMKLLQNLKFWMMVVFDSVFVSFKFRFSVGVPNSIKLMVFNVNFARRINYDSNSIDYNYNCWDIISNWGYQKKYFF